MRVFSSRDYSEPRDAISHDWARYLEKIGILPILIPNALKDPVAFCENANVTALIFTGGGDVPTGTGWMDSDIKPADLEELRSRTETGLFNWARDLEMPVLGVCRGMHMINVIMGGGIVRDLGELDIPPETHVGNPHEIAITDARWKQKLGAARVTVNSFHLHAVTKDSLSPDLVPFAMADETIVEGFYHPARPITGIQWHPERENPTDKFDRIIISFLSGTGG
jgi:gamma-glutamyl-gamma-aminobutyrate hydrolase PuuD